MNIPAALPLSNVDAAWLAGLLDGEGAFDAPRDNPRVRVKMTDFDVVLHAADLMGASVYTEIDRRADHYKPLLIAQITGDRAVAVMRAILPYLGARRTAKVTELTIAHSTRQARISKRHLKEVLAA
jgi:hypothetical protein